MCDKSDDVIVVAATQDGGIATVKVLALHGWRTSASILKFQIRDLSKNVTYVVPNATHAAKGPPQEIVSKFFQGPYFEWFDHVAGVYQGIEETFEHLRKLDEEHGPFHGVLGFSQGACLAAIICAMRANQEQRCPLPSVKFGVLISGMLPREQTYLSMFDKPISFPIFGTYGERDFLKENADALFKHFEAPKVEVHTGGHEVPTRVNGSNVLEALDTFLEAQTTATNAE